MKRLVAKETEVGSVPEAAEKGGKNARSLHILHIIESLENRGAERQVMLLTTELRRRGHRVEVCCLRPGGELTHRLREACIPVFEFDKSGRVDLGLLRKLMWFVRTGQFDVVHTHVFTANLWGRLAAWFGNVPVVLSHEHGDFTLSSPFRMTVNRILSRFTDRSFVVSQELIRRFEENNHIPRGKLVLVPNGLDFTRLNGQVSDLKPLFERVFPVIGTVGALEPRKDHHTFLYAARLLLKRFPSAQFLIVGDGELLRELEDQAHRLHLEGHLHLLGKRNDVFAILKLMHVFVLSSVTEGTSIALLEALAAGRPVVATSVGGNPEVLQWGRLGSLVPPRNPLALAQSIETLLSDRKQCQRMGAAAQKFVLENHNIERTASKLERLYYQILQKKHLER